MEVKKNSVIKKNERTKKTNDYFCFYDSEFNAYDANFDLSIPQEVVSIGVCIVDKKNVLIEDFYSLIALKGAKHISKRCEKLTGITNKDVKKAPSFIDVVDGLYKVITKYNIKIIYCYGTEDKKAFIRTARLYKENNKMKEIEKRLVDIREEFKKKTKTKLGDQGLLFLKRVCGLGDSIKHNALSDAVDLSDIYNVIMHNGYSEDLYKILMKEREETMNYKRARNVKEEHSIVAPNEVIKAKNIIIDFLQKYKVPNMNEGTKKAIIDDLDILLVKK